MDILIWNPLSESIFDFGKWSNWKYANTRQKLIPKTDFKWECPYYYSKFFLECFGQYLEKSKNGFPIVFSNFQLARADSFFRDRPLYI